MCAVVALPFAVRNMLTLQPAHSHVYTLMNVHDRIDIYCGKKQHAATPTDLDVHAGASAVQRNLDAILPMVGLSWRGVVNLYIGQNRSSVAALTGESCRHCANDPSRLLHGNRELAQAPTGICGAVSLQIAVAKQYPKMDAMSWMDS